MTRARFVPDARAQYIAPALLAGIVSDAGAAGIAGAVLLERALQSGINLTIYLDTMNALVKRGRVVRDALKYIAVQS